MKSFVVLCVVLLAEIHAEDIQLDNCPPPENERANEKARECIAETGVPFDVLSEIPKGNLPDDDCLKDFLYCFLIKHDIVTRDGQLNVEVSVSKLPQNLDKNYGRKLLERCKTKTGKDVNVALPPEQNEKIKINAFECIAETGVSFQALAEVKNGNIPDDEGLKQFNFCFFKKVGIFNNDGQLNVDVALAKLPPSVDKTEMKELLETCKTKSGKDAVDTAAEIFKCYFYGSKVRIVLNID